MIAIILLAIAITLAALKWWHVDRAEVADKAAHWLMAYAAGDRARRAEFARSMLLKPVLREYSGHQAAEIVQMIREAA